VDRSQLHTEFVNSRLDARGKDEVRLLKRFMKNFGIYGAELRVEGFSGYLCELLVIHYGSVLGLMEAAGKWREPLIDTAGHHKEATGLREKFNAPLIVVDPTDPSRNVAAVVSHASLSRFIFECRRFLVRPSDAFFFSKKKIRGLGEIRMAMKSRRTRCVSLAFDAPDAVPDVLWPQLKKTTQALVRHLSSLDFSVFDYYYWSDGKECVILMELDRWELPAVRKAVGPAIRFSDDCDSFVAQHAKSLNLHMEHDRIVAVEKREITDCKTALVLALRKPDGIGMPQGMAETMKKKCSVIDGERIIMAKYSEFLSDYFFAKIA
jgi:tRNA nucleotidyltransferase (CCA-adding enzyme)